jgi:hypothetical protein
MAEITDIEKLNPDLLKLSAAEIKRRMTELQMALDKKEEQEKAELRKLMIEEAGHHVDAVLTGLRWLEEHKFLSEAVVAFLSTEKGQFMPHLKFKRPRT